MNLWIVAALIAAALAMVAVVWTRLSRRRVQADPMPFNCDRCGFTAEHERQVTIALDLVAERDQAKADHTNDAMRRLTEDT